MAIQPNKARLWKLLSGLTRGNLVSALSGGLYKPDLGQIQRQSSDGDVTIAADDTLVVFAVDCTGGNRTITMPSAIAGRRIRVIWEVEQATNNRVFTRAGSDTFAGNIFTNEAGNAAGDGDVVAIANTTVTITCIDDVNIGSYLDFHCAVDALWLVTGHLVLDADGNVPTLA
jgi:hypothetical protein